MKGHLVRLTAIEEEDYPLLAGWFTVGLVGALATGSSQDFCTASDIRKAIQAGSEKFALVKTHEGERVGLVQWQQRKYPGSYSVGGVIGDRDLWDSGCGIEAAWLLTHYLFHTKNAHRVEFTTSSYNKRVVQMILKSGMAVEGILRDYFFHDGEYHDAIVTSCLREEYYRKEDGASASEMFGDTIPRNDKTETREIIQDYIRTQWHQDFLKSYLER